MNFCNQRAGGVDDAQLALLRFLANARGNAMRAEHQYCSLRNLRNRLHEDGSASPQLVYYVAVVDDFVMHVHRAAVSLQRQLDDVDSAYHTRAETTRSDAHESLHPFCALSVIRALNVGQH